MLFNSFEFIIFAVLFFAIWPFLLQKKNRRLTFLIVASFVFYGWWDWRFLFLIIVSGLIDYFGALAIVRWPTLKRLWLLISLSGNIGSLGIFKYGEFFASNLDFLFAKVGLHINLAQNMPDFLLILPVGISFYTFQSMSYTIDVYRGELKPTRNPLLFFAYLAMFPQLVAGPIVRARDLLPQLENPIAPSESVRWEGTKLIIYGFFKKVLIADHLGLIVNSAFANEVMQTGTMYWWMVMVGFAIQIYCDFSGYSDIARGLAKWMGCEFPLNFSQPYFSTSLREFWTRWHISLSSWFRDYVYIPLGGSRKGKVSAHSNMWSTMVLSGLWHGAAWNFVIWGAIHSFFLSLERATGYTDYLSKRTPMKIVLWAMVMVQVLVAWVFFRADSFSQACFILQNMFVLQESLVPSSLLAKFMGLFALFTIAEVIVYLKIWERLKMPESIRVGIELAYWPSFLFACVLYHAPSAQFIYFQF